MSYGTNYNILLNEAEECVHDVIIIKRKKRRKNCIYTSNYIYN